MSAETVSINVIPVGSQKGSRLYDIFVIKVAFSSLYFVFRVFLLISYLFLKSIAFIWCDELVIAVQAILR